MEALPSFCLCQDAASQNLHGLLGSLMLQLDWGEPKTVIHCFKATGLKVGESPRERPPSSHRIQMQ